MRKSKLKNIKLTKHGTTRIRDRVNNLNKRRMNTLFSNAYLKGYSINELNNPLKTKLARQLYKTNSRQKYKRKLKVYRGYVFIYCNRTLITVYPIPKEYEDCVPKGENKKSKRGKK